MFCFIGGIEVHNSVRLKYCPKRSHFSLQGMVARNQLAVLDHNENIRRPVAQTYDGNYTIMATLNMFLKYRFLK